MNTRIEIQDYSLWIDDDLSALTHYLEHRNFTKLAVVCDQQVGKYCLPILNLPQDVIISEFAEGEQHKNMNTVEAIWSSWLEAGLDRKALVLLLGGGVTGDMGGFAACCFKRGLDFIHVPTSLMAMADSSIGGKLGVDMRQVKNAIGLFRNPKAIFVHLPFLSTLPEAELRSGWIEVIKHALLNGRRFFEEIVSHLHTKGLPMSRAILEQSIGIKKNFVERDPFEASVRKALNFGHTIGHAIESYCLAQDQPISHGHAVCLGMIAESRISHLLGLLSEEDLNLIMNLLLPFYPSIRISYEDLAPYLRNDKKNEGDTVLFSLLSQLGGYVINKAVTPSVIRAALK